MPPRLPISQTRVIKKLAPGTAGTKRLSQRYGKDLVCVRYRQDREGQHRYTTVEIVVDSGPMTEVAMQTMGHLVRIGLDESDLRKAAVTLGAVWDKQKRAWRMSKDAIKALQMQRRMIVK